MGLPEEEIREISSFFRGHITYEDHLGNIRIITDHIDWNDYVAFERESLIKRRTISESSIETELQERIRTKLTLNDIETLAIRFVGSRENSMKIVK